MDGWSRYWICPFLGDPRTIVLLMSNHLTLLNSVDSLLLTNTNTNKFNIHLIGLEELLIDSKKKADETN